MKNHCFIWVALLVAILFMPLLASATPAGYTSTSDQFIGYSGPPLAQDAIHEFQINAFLGDDDGWDNPGKVPIVPGSGDIGGGSSDVQAMAGHPDYGAGATDPCRVCNIDSIPALAFKPDEHW